MLSDLYDWYKYMMVDRGRVVPNGSLCLITGCIKTKSWCIATFHGRPNDSNRLQFNADGQPRIPGYGWTPKISPSTEEPNQCVFLRGYKIILSQEGWEKLEELAASASQSGLSGLPPTRITSVNQEGSRNRNNQSIPQASAHSHNLSQPAFGEAETTGLQDLSQQGSCNPALPNASDNDMEQGAVDEDTVEVLAGVASPVGHLIN